MRGELKTTQFFAVFILRKGNEENAQSETNQAFGIGEAAFPDITYCDYACHFHGKRYISFRRQGIPVFGYVSPVYALFSGISKKYKGRRRDFVYLECGNRIQFLGVVHLLPGKSAALAGFPGAGAISDGIHELSGHSKDWLLRTDLLSLSQ